MKTNARNQLQGEIVEVKKGDMMCKVKVKVPACEMASVMTVESAEEMDLKPGDKVAVVTKAVNILLIKD